MWKSLILAAIIASIFVMVCSEEEQLANEYSETSTGSLADILKGEFSIKLDSIFTQESKKKSAEESRENFAAKSKEPTKKKINEEGEKNIKQLKHKSAEESKKKSGVETREESAETLIESPRNISRKESNDNSAKIIKNDSAENKKEKYAEKAKEKVSGKVKEQSEELSKKQSSEIAKEQNRKSEEKEKASSANTVPCKHTSSSSKCLQEAKKLFVEGNIAVGGTLLKELIRSNPGESLLGSGAVILVLLSELALSAEGGAYKQIMNALNFNKKESIKCLFSRTISTLAKSNEYNSFTKIYSDDVCPLTEEFKKQTKDVFTFEPQNLHFRNQKSARIISKEVEEYTNGYIVNYIEANFLRKLSGVVLVAAEYYKGQWVNQFDPALTKERKFYVSSKTVRVPIMYQRGTFLYTQSDELGAKMVKMKFIGGDFSFVVILPNLGESLRDVVERVRNPRKLIQALDDLRPENVKIYLPTFNISAANQLKYPLQKAKVTKIFYNKTAGLEDITYGGGTYVSDVLQKSRLEINEYGSGTTKISESNTEEDFAQVEDKTTYTFRANRPFIYFLFYEKFLTFYGVFIR